MVDTPAEQWKKTITEYRKKCQDILKISDSIRYAGVINQYGRTLAGMLRPKLQPLLESSQAKNEFFLVPTLISMRKYSVKALGRMDYMLLHHGKISIVILQKDSVTYYVTIDKKEKDLVKIVSQVKKMI